MRGHNANFSLINKQKLSLNYPRQPFLSGALYWRTAKVYQTGCVIGYEEVINPTLGFDCPRFNMTYKYEISNTVTY